MNRNIVMLLIMGSAMAMSMQVKAAAWQSQEERNEIAYNESQINPGTKVLSGEVWFTEHTGAVRKDEESKMKEVVVKETMGMQ
jgi:hypothetical protein